MQSNIKEWVCACQYCQKAKIHRRTVSPSGQFSPSTRFLYVHKNIVEDLKMYAGFSYLCTFIDREIKWIEAVPIRKVEKEIVVKALCNTWVSSFVVQQIADHSSDPNFSFNCTNYWVHNTSRRSHITPKLRHEK